MAAADAAMASGVTYRSFIFFSLCGWHRLPAMSAENWVPVAYWRQLVQAWGQTAPPVCVLATGPDCVPEFRIAGPYGTSG
jgi:hypothetical protein